MCIPEGGRACGGRRSGPDLVGDLAIALRLLPAPTAAQGSEAESFLGRALPAHPSPQQVTPPLPSPKTRGMVA